MDKKNAGFIQSDEVLLLPTKQPPPYPENLNKSSETQTQSTSTKKKETNKNSSTGKGSSGTGTRTTSNYVFISDPGCYYSNTNTTVAAATDGVNLSTASNVAFGSGNPSLTPAITVPPGPNTSMTSGITSDVLPSSSDVVPVIQVTPGPSGDILSSGAVLLRLHGRPLCRPL
ncbi:hypothetical protein BGZ97_007388 [Linnemannia gamsii]|uniref:Uncharacterized protein n=1 Tax=Linnemannia gamsii TaxID=64522 RepID=A0A9P6QS73_9FUNG|nr:hypothetical protein BGZ97_007388 [Linnemannia gamsii]